MRTPNRNRNFEDRNNSRREILDKLEEGSVISGKVKSITNYGAFIDIGGIDGLLHISDMKNHRVSHPSDVVNVGDTINVKILAVDKERQRISLGLKQLEEDQ